jgi:GT2 family glycosyltransferase
MKVTPSVAIVILNFNGKEYLNRNLQFLFRISYRNTSLVVIDNASTDDSVAWLQQQHPAIKLIINEANFGFAKGYNAGLRHIESDYYLLLNTDVEVTESLLEPMIALLQQDDQAAACQPKICSLNARDHFEYAGAGGGQMDVLGYPFARGRLFFSCERDIGQYDDEQEVFWASGACFLIRRTCFWEENGFYEFYFMQHEETDLCWRLKQKGYKILYTGKSVVYHQGGAHLGYADPKKNFLNFRNNWIMLYRNVPRCYFWLYIVPFRTGLDVAASFYFLFRNNFATFLSVHKALFRFWLWWWPNRQHTGTATPIRSLAGVYKGWIVIDYFIKNKKALRRL